MLFVVSFIIILTFALSIVISSLSFLIFVISVIFFFLVSSASLSNLLTFFKEPTFHFTESLYSVLFVCLFLILAAFTFIFFILLAFS